MAPTHDQFELVIKGKERIVTIEPNSTEYDVTLDGTFVGRVWRTNGNKWLCNRTDSDTRYAGKTRRAAAIQMIFARARGL